MAKRFGRNQRRQMREALARTEHLKDLALERLRKQETAYNRLARELQNWAQDIADLMGPDSAFNRYVREMGWQGGDTIRLMPPVQLQSVSSRPEPMVASVVTVMEAAVRRLSVDHDDQQHVVRIRLRNPRSEDLYFVIDERQVTERDAALFADHIARQFQKMLNANASPSRRSRAPG